MDFTGVSRTADTWPYEQLAAIIREAVRSGELKRGEKLPAVARIAQEAGVSKDTVSNALAALRAEGVIYTVDRLGTFVAGPLPPE